LVFFFLAFFDDGDEDRLRLREGAGVTFSVPAGASSKNGMKI
jgi:hypothetical protein